MIEKDNVDVLQECIRKMLDIEHELANMSVDESDELASIRDTLESGWQFLTKLKRLHRSLMIDSGELYIKYKLGPGRKDDEA